MFSSGIATVFVTDMDRAVKFYTDILGLKLMQRFENHWASVADPATRDRIASGVRAESGWPERLDDLRFDGRRENR